MKFKRELRVGDWVRDKKYSIGIGEIHNIRRYVPLYHDFLCYDIMYSNSIYQNFNFDTFINDDNLEPVFDFDYFKGQRLIICCNEHERKIFRNLIDQERSAQECDEYATMHWNDNKVDCHYEFNNFENMTKQEFMQNLYIFKIDFKDIINNTYKTKNKKVEIPSIIQVAEAMERLRHTTFDIKYLAKSCNVDIDEVNTDMFDKKKTKKPFTKSDLRNGDVIKRRNGSVEIVAKETHWEAEGFITKCGFNDLCEINNDLTYNNYVSHKALKEWDIIQVRRPSCISECQFSAFEYNHGALVYNREEEPLWNGKTYEENHRILWNMLADNPNMSKKEVIDKMNVNGEEHPLYECFACEYACSLNLIGIGYVCDKCPICRRENDEKCLNGLYNKWDEATGFEKAKLAHRIANLKWTNK